jgi:hypothetical protein
VIVSWIDDDGHPMHFKVIEVAGEYEGTTLYSSSGNDYTDKIEEATPQWAGSIRFDGCMNFDRPERKRDNVMDHLCGIRGLNERYALFTKLYAIAAERMPKWKEYLT